MLAPATNVQTSQRIGVLGGTFDPIHLGHLAAASEVYDVLGLDQILLVPTFAQPLKAAPLASDEQRVAMCEVAIQGDARLAVSRVDVERGGATFTVDTLADLREQFPDAELTFISGADSLATLERWKDAERLLGLARFVGVTRPGHAVPPLPANVPVVEVPSVAVSSTEVRRRVGAGAPIKYLVPDAVVAYIEEHSLYLGGSHD